MEQKIQNNKKKLKSLPRTSSKYPLQLSPKKKVNPNLKKQRGHHLVSKAFLEKSKSSKSLDRYDRDSHKIFTPVKTIMKHSES